LDQIKLTTQNDWDEYYGNKKNNSVSDIVFSNIFNKYLVPNSKLSILEIGCAGGKFLCWLTKKFGYQAFGIDYSEQIDKTYELFRSQGMSRPTLFKEDFFNWNPVRTFDIVCSFGFIEHFSNPSEILKKHCDILSPGGLLIVTLPHFAHGQYFFHRLIDNDNLKKHNLDIMKLHAIRTAMSSLPVEIIHLDYYKTFGFWTENDDLSRTNSTTKYLIKKIGKVIQFIFGYDRPNFLFSPHIVCVAKKI
jgi:cyclopropane fatty-acyl-phospholipid synthase-like methyltransferase